jgi:hypothetical protein
MNQSQTVTTRTAAWTESILLLTTLSQYWEAHLAADAHVVFQPIVTLRPQYGVKMTLHKRVPATTKVSDDKTLLSIVKDSSE